MEREELWPMVFGAASLETADNAATATRQGSGGIGVEIAQARNGWGKRHLVRFRAASDGQVTVQIESRSGMREISDGPALQGEIAWLVLGSGVTRLRAYSDDGSWVRLTVDEVIDCASTDSEACMSDEDFKHSIFPNGMPSDPHARLAAIVHWASNHADYGVSPELERRTRSYVSALTAREAYTALFEQNRGAGYCGTQAAFLAGLLELFGYDAMTLDYGAQEHGLTHVTTLVFSPFGEGRVYVVDATFNFHVEDGAGAWADLEQIVRQPSEAVVATRPMNRRDFLVGSADRMQGLTDCQPSDDLMVCRYDRFGLDNFLSENYAALTAAGLSPTPQGFLGLIGKSEFYGVTGGSPEARAALARILGASV